MKKIPLANVLDLSKEIVASLSDDQLQEIEGGAFTKSLQTILSCVTGSGSCSGATPEEEVAE